MMDYWGAPVQLEISDKLENEIFSYMVFMHFQKDFKQLIAFMFLRSSALHAICVNVVKERSDTDVGD